jgi:hypothetical protein
VLNFRVFRVFFSSVFKVDRNNHCVNCVDAARRERWGPGGPRGAPTRVVGAPTNHPGAPTGPAFAPTARFRAPTLRARAPAPKHNAYVWMPQVVPTDRSA